MARILVVDDSPEVRMVIRQTLEMAGHEVAEAADGDKGIRAYRQQPFDLVITDIFMPEKEGLGVIRELREEFGDVKIIAMSGGSPKVPRSFLKDAHKFGAKETLAKPFDAQTLIAAVERALK